jgi:lysophospholipase L1-like esterase
MNEKDKNIQSNPDIKGVINNAIWSYMQEQKKNKLITYKMLNKYIKKGQILFVGSSLMEWFPIDEMQLISNKNYVIYNRGIAGYLLSELLTSMNECIFDLEPSKIFINIGTNDMNTSDYKKGELISNYDSVLTEISEKLPQCKVYVMAYYPVNAEADFSRVDKEYIQNIFKTRSNASITEINEAFKELARKHNYEFINVNGGLTDDRGHLKEEFSVDGIHMWPNAYAVILKNMEKYL